MVLRGTVILTLAFFLGVILHARMPQWFQPGLSKIGIA